MRGELEVVWMFVPVPGWNQDAPSTGYYVAKSPGDKVVAGPFRTATEAEHAKARLEGGHR